MTFARQVLELDASRGATVGVFGPWGSGKTSFVNLARKTFEREGVPVLDFNPWLFSGAEQLVERFFAELSASMGMTDELEEIGDAFRRYGAALNAVAGVASALLAAPQIGAIVAKLTELRSMPRNREASTPCERRSKTRFRNAASRLSCSRRR